jgi:hypothetical protein
VSCCLSCRFHGKPVSDYTGPRDMCGKCIASGKCSEKQTVPFVETSYQKETEGEQAQEMQ